MNENLKQFPEAIAKELKAKIESADFAAFIEKVQKDTSDDRSFEVVMSTSDEDRQGDALDQSGWDFKYFDMNPVLLWAHDYQGFPIGIISDIRIEGDKSVATGKFAPKGLNPEADLACALYQEKILRAVSPGYIQNDDGTRELLEVSFCPVPAGRYALSMRQVRTIGASTRELITKGFFFDEKSKKDPPETKTPQLGDHCQGDDGTPGVLADDPKNPGTMICVPVEDKSNETQDDMNNELEKKLKAEHERHGGEITKAIDEFEKALTPEEKAEGSDNSEMEKAIDEFKDATDGEHAEHLEKCMKAVDDAYDMDPEEKKSIDEFKKAVEDEHLTHVKAFHKAIEEFKDSAAGDPEKCEKALDEFRTKAESELSRHEEAHKELCEAEFGEGEDDEKKIQREADELVQKAGRAISAANKAKIDAVVKAIEEYHAQHTADHEKFSNNVIAALKELSSSPQGGEGKEDEDEKSHAPNARSSSAGAATNKEASMSELDAYLFAQRLMRQVKSASEDGLRQIKENLKAKYPSRR